MTITCFVRKMEDATSMPTVPWQDPWRGTALVGLALLAMERVAKGPCRRLEVQKINRHTSENTLTVSATNFSF